MKTSESTKEIFAAQITMQSELMNVAKDATGYGYKYTKLETLIDHAKPILFKNGLGYIQTNTSTDDGRVGVTTRLIHTSGEWVEDTMTAPLYKLAKMNEYQVAGSVITYFRRYALASMLGVASDEDIDAAGEQQESSISNQQATILNGLINDSNTDISMFKTHYNVSKLTDLSQDDFKKAVAQLQAKIKKANK
jgi:hypothetical protein